MSSDEDELEVVGEDNEEDEEYVQYDIAAYPSDLTLNVLHEMFNKGDIFIPEYQRRFIWNMKQSSLLIESFLLGLPVPQVFFYVDYENRYEVIDGQQRILSFCHFFEGYFGEESTQGNRRVFRLTGLNKKSPFYNKTFEELDDTSQRKLESAVLRAINIRQLNPEDNTSSAYHIFERLNTGGTPLKPQEIRNVVYRGAFVLILRDLNKNKYWRMILGKDKFDKHQRDVGLILRIFSLYDEWQSYENPMKRFLNNAMDRHKSGNTKKVKRFQRLFPEVCGYIIDEFGEKPFHIRGPINSSALDSVFCILLENNGIKVSCEKYKKLQSDENFLKTISLGTSDTSVLKRRFNIAQEILIG